MSRIPGIALVLVLFTPAGCKQPAKRQQQRGVGKTPHMGAPRSATRPVTAVPSEKKPLSPPPARGSGPWPFADAPPTDPAAARRRAMTIADYYRVKYVSDPQLSPDGKRVAFVRSTYDLEKGSRNTDIFVVGTDGKGLRQLTRSKKSDRSPRWSPDGKKLLFISGRRDGSQLFLMDLAGGDPEQLTKIGTGVSGPEWSPDGRHIAFVSRVFPEHGADDKANRKRLKKQRKGAVQAVLADDLLFRHWTSYDDGRRKHILLFDVKSRKVSDLTPGKFHAPPISLGHGRGFAFSPDSRELCFTSNHDPPDRRASSTNNDVFVVPLKGGKPTNVTRTNKAWDGSCAYSPDGRFLSYRMQRIPGYEADRLRLALLDRKSGQLRVLTDTFDYWVIRTRWLPDSKRILLSAAVRGRYPLYVMDVQTGKLKPLPAPPNQRGFVVSRDGKTVVFRFSSVARPPELFAVQIDGSQPRRLTQENEPLRQEVDFRPAEELWLPGDGGRKVHVFVVKPHGYRPGRKYPLILNVHGGPQMQWSDRFRGDWQVYPGAGYVVAFPNPHGSLGYGQAYTAAISKDWGGKVYRDVLAVTDGLARLPYVDAKRIGVMGWSYGGYLVNWIGTRTKRYQALASMMGVYDLRSFYGATEEQWFPEWDLGGQPWTPRTYEKFSPSRFVKRWRTPTLILTGARDYRVPYTQSLQLFTDLRKQGVPARLIVFKNDGHWPSHVRSMPVYYNAHLEWFHRYLGGGPAPWDTRQLIRNQVFGKDKKKN